MPEEFEFSFTTTGAPDTTPPTVSSRSPTAGATGVSISANGTITFNEEMLASSINNTNCKILLTSGLVNQAAAVTLSADKKIVTINPTANLAPSRGFTLRAVGGGTGCKDLTGNALATTSDITFHDSGSSFHFSICNK